MQSSVSFPSAVPTAPPCCAAKQVCRLVLQASMKSATKASYLTHHAWSSESEQLAQAADQRKTPPCAAAPPSHQALPAEAPADNTRTVLTATHHPTGCFVHRPPWHLRLPAMQHAMLARCGISGFGVKEQSTKRAAAVSSVLTALSQHLHFSAQAVQALLTGKSRACWKGEGCTAHR